MEHGSKVSLADMDSSGVPRGAVLQYLSQAAGAQAKKKCDVLYAVAENERVQRERAERLASASKALGEPLPLGIAAPSPARGLAAAEASLASADATVAAAASLGLPPQAAARAQALAEARAVENATLMNKQRALEQRSAELGKALQHVRIHGASIWRPLDTAALQDRRDVAAQDSGMESPLVASRGEPAPEGDALSRLVAQARATVARGPATLENLRRDRERIKQLAISAGIAPSTRDAPLPPSSNNRHDTLEAMQAPQPRESPLALQKQPSLQPVYPSSLPVESNMPRAMMRAEAESPQRRLWGDRQAPDAPEDLVRGALAAQPLLAGGAPGGAGDSVARLAAAGVSPNQITGAAPRSLASQAGAPAAGDRYAPPTVSHAAAAGKSLGPPPLPAPFQAPSHVSNTEAHGQHREAADQHSAGAPSGVAAQSRPPSGAAMPPPSGAAMPPGAGVFDQSENIQPVASAPPDGITEWAELGATTDAQPEDPAAPAIQPSRPPAPDPKQRPRRRRFLGIF